MPRGRGRPPTARRGRPKSSHPVQEPVEPPMKKKRGPGRPPRKSAELAMKQAEERAAEEELQAEIEEMQNQVQNQTIEEPEVKAGPAPKKRKSVGRPKKVEPEEDELVIEEQLPAMDDEQSCGLHVSTMQIRALSNLVACKDCGEAVTLSVRPTTKGMISEFVVGCTVCEAKKVTITPNFVRERKRKREVKGLVLQKTENINYAHVAAFLDNGLGYSGLRHYCKYFNARCLNEATFIVYARQVIQDVVNDTEDNLQSNARIVRKVYDAGLDEILDITVSYTTTYHQWGSDFCLVAGAVIELQTGLVLDYDVANMYCHVCKINAKRIISMTPSEMTEWFTKHQSSCEIREWCDELDHDAEEGVKDIEPKYLECFVAKKIWARSIEKFGFRYSTLIHESDETIHNELLRSAPYGDTLVMIDNLTNCFRRRKSEHARTAFQNKLKSKCPRERVQTKDRIMYVYAMSIPEYNRFAVGSNIRLRELVRSMELEDEEAEGFTMQVLDTLPTIQADEVIPADGETSEVIYAAYEDGETEEEAPTEMEALVEEEEETEKEPSSPSKAVNPDIKRERIAVETDDTESVEKTQETEANVNEKDSSEKKPAQSKSVKAVVSASTVATSDEPVTTVTTTAASSSSNGTTATSSASSTAAVSTSESPAVSSAPSTTAASSSSATKVSLSSSTIQTMRVTATTHTKNVTKISNGVESESKKDSEK